MRREMMANKYSLMGLLIAAGLLFSAQTACTVVRYYKVSDVRKGFKNTETKTAKALKRLTRDVQRHRSVISKAQNAGRNLSRKPYPELRRLVGAMGKIRDALFYKQRDIAKLRKRFERIVGPRRVKVRSDEADYPRVRKVFDDLKTLHKGMKELVKRYNKKAKQFKKLIHRHQIR